MRTLFWSLTRPKHLAARLHQLLPALTLSHCHDWTAQVCGYRNWHELAEVTKNNSKAEVATSQDIDEEARDNYRIEKLAGLLGSRQNFLVRLYVEWGLDQPRAPKTPRLPISAEISIDGRMPISSLLREDLSVMDRLAGTRTYIDDGNLSITNGFAETDDKKAMAHQFMDDLPDADLPFEEMRMVGAVVLYSHDYRTVKLRKDDEGTLFQQYAVRVMAFEQVPRRLIGTVTLHIGLRLKADGKHMLLIEVDDAALIDDEDGIALAYLTEGAAKACDNYMLRYALSTVGNADSTALIRLHVHSENLRNGDIATGMLRHLKQNLNGRTKGGGFVHGRNNVSFELVDLLDDEIEDEAVAESR